jgi:hypothetical protein
MGSMYARSDFRYFSFSLAVWLYEWSGKETSKLFVWHQAYRHGALYPAYICDHRRRRHALLAGKFSGCLSVVFILLGKGHPLYFTRDDSLFRRESLISRL